MTSAGDCGCFAPSRPPCLQIGLGFSVIFLSFFLYFAKGAQFKALVTSMLVGGVVLAAVYAGVIAPSYDHDTKVSVLGGLAVAFNVVMYAAPISQLVRAPARVAWLLSLYPLHWHVGAHDCLA